MRQTNRLIFMRRERRAVHARCDFGENYFISLCISRLIFPCVTIDVISLYKFLPFGKIPSSYHRLDIAPTSRRKIKGNGY